MRQAERRLSWRLAESRGQRHRLNLRQRLRNSAQPRRQPLNPLQVKVRVVLPRKADAAVHLHTYMRHVLRGFNGGELTPARMAHAVQQTRKAGYSEIVDTITTGVVGVGRTFSASSATLAAISFGAISSRLPAVRRKEMGQLLVAQLPAPHHTA